MFLHDKIKILICFLYKNYFIQKNNFFVKDKINKEKINYLKNILQEK